jgi:uncharacterized protein with HEPN domain
MSKYNPQLAFRQILAYAIKAVEIPREKERADLDQDRLLNLALTRLIEVIGDAVKKKGEACLGHHR